MSNKEAKMITVNQNEARDNPHTSPNASVEAYYCVYSCTQCYTHSVHIHSKTN